MTFWLVGFDRYSSQVAVFAVVWRSYAPPRPPKSPRRRTVELSEKVLFVPFCYPLVLCEQYCGLPRILLQRLLGAILSDGGVTPDYDSPERLLTGISLSRFQAAGSKSPAGSLSRVSNSETHGAASASAGGVDLHSRPESRSRKIPIHVTGSVAQGRTGAVAVAALHVSIEVVAEYELTGTPCCWGSASGPGSA